jgi:hypothetical protein
LAALALFTVARLLPGLRLTTLTPQLLHRSLELGDAIAELLRPRQLIREPTSVGRFGAGRSPQAVSHAIECASQLFSLASWIAIGRTLARLVATALLHTRSPGLLSFACARLSQRLCGLAHSLGQSFALELTRRLIDRLLLATLALRTLRELSGCFSQALHAFRQSILLARQPSARVLASLALWRARGLIRQPTLRVGKLPCFELQIADGTLAIVGARRLHLALEIL